MQEHALTYSGITKQPTTGMCPIDAYACMYIHTHIQLMM